MDPEYLDNLYALINKHDLSFKNSLSLDQFKQKMLDSDYAERLTSWVKDREPSFEFQSPQPVGDGKKKAFDPFNQEPYKPSPLAPEKSTTESSSGIGSSVSSLVEDVQSNIGQYATNLEEKKKLDSLRQFEKPMEQETPIAQVQREENLTAPLEQVQQKGAFDIKMADIEAAVPEMAKSGINAIDQNVINKSIESFAETMNYDFPGFAFEKSGSSLKMTAPDGTVEYVNWLKGPEETADNVKYFVKTKSADKDWIDKVTELYKGENQKFQSNLEVEMTLKEFAKEQQELVDSQNDFIKRKKEAEDNYKAIIDMPLNQRDAQYRDNKYKAEKALEAIGIEGMEIQKKVNDSPKRQKDLEKAIFKYNEKEGKSRSLTGYLGNKLLDAIGDIGGQAVSTYIDIKTSLPLNILLGEDEYRKVFNEKFIAKGYLDKDVTPTDVNAINAEIRDEIRKKEKYGSEEEMTFMEGNRVVWRKVFGDKGTTEQAMAIMDQGYLTGTLGAAVQVVPMLITPGGWGKVAAGYLQGAAFIDKEFESDPELAKTSESEKNALKMPLGMIIAALDKLGLDEVVKGSGIIKSIAGKILPKATPGMSVTAFNKLAQSETAKMFTTGAIRVFDGALVEGITGSLEEVASISGKELFNMAKGIDLFKNPNSVIDFIGQVGWAGVQEASVGVTVTTPFAVAEAFNKNDIAGIPEVYFNTFVASANDPVMEKAFVASLKNKVSIGDIKKSDAVDLLNNYRNSVGLIRSIPEEISENKDKQKAMELLRQRKALEAKKEGKDDALAKPINDRIAAINEQLSKLTEDAIQKQTAGQVPVQPEAGVGEAVVEGEPESKPQIAPEESKRKENLVAALEATDKDIIVIGDEMLDRKEAQSELDAITQKEQTTIAEQGGMGTELEAVPAAEVTPAEVRPAEAMPIEQQFTEQDRARKAELEEAMRKADKRKKNVMVGEVSMPKADIKTELEALNQKEQAAPIVETAPVETMTADQEADLLEELMTGKKKEPVAAVAPTITPITPTAESTSKEAIAKRLRGKKSKGLMSSIDFGITRALYNGALEFMAKQVEKGTKLGNAITDTIKWIDEKMQGKNWDKDGFTKYANTTFEEVVTKKKAKDILDVYPKGSIVSITDLASESGDTIIGNVLSKMKDVFDSVKISGRRPNEGAAFYNYNTKEIDINKNSPHWDEVEGDQITSALSHEFAHHLIDGHPDKEAIENELQQIKDDLIANKPELTESQKQAYEFMTSKNNSSQEILTYAVSDPDIRQVLEKYKDKLNNISNKLFGEDVISGIFEDQKTKENEIRSKRGGDREGRTEIRPITPLEGAPSVPGFNGPDPQLVTVAEEYAKENGIPYKRQADFVKVDEGRAKRIAEAYEEMKHDPQNPKVKEAYENLIKQTIAQYEALAKAGYKFWFIDTNIPSNLEYAQSPFNAMRDVRSNKQMGVFPTTDGFGSSDVDVSDNPMMAETKFKWPVGGMDGELKPVLANDLFRAVHDAFGHGLEGAGFRARGEENAWQAHIRLFTGSAVGAITTETRGQNSWLNFGPYGEKNRTANTDETIFADQKTGLMPEWTWKEGVAADMEPTAKPFATSLADAIVKNLTIKTGGLQSNILGIPIAIWNSGVKTMAAAVRAGAAINEAIQKAIEHIREKHGKKFNEAAAEKKLLIGQYKGAIGIAREAKVTNEGLKAYFKRQGLTDAQIEVLLTFKEKAEKKPISKEKIVGKPKRKPVTIKDDYAAMVNQIKLEIKASKSGAKSVTDAIKAIVGYVNKMSERGNLTRKDLRKILNLIPSVKNQKSLDKAADVIYDIIKNATTDIVEVSDYKAMVIQMKLEARAARAAKGDLNAKRKMMNKVIKDMEKGGKITTAQAETLIKKMNSLNLDNPDMVWRFINYAEKVFNDAEYGVKLSAANKLQAEIKELSENKTKFGNLTPFAAKFATIDPSMVDDIDTYIENATAVKEGVAGSKVTASGLRVASAVDVDGMMGYVDKSIENQDEVIRLRTSEKIEELLGIDVKDLKYEDMLQLIDSNNPDAKIEAYKETIIRSTINKLFNTYSSIIDSMFETGVDSFTGNPVTFSKSEMELVKSFMDMDLSKMDTKDAIRAADALNNFIVNKSTANMANVLARYTGPINADIVDSKGVNPKPLKMWGSKAFGKNFYQLISSVPLLFEKAFNGASKGAYVMKMMGVTSLINHKAEAQRMVTDTINEYAAMFAGKKPNGKSFQSAYNVIERGIVADLSKTIIGTDKQIQSEFNRRKRLIQESIEILRSGGTKKETEMANTVEEIYNKIVRDSENISEVKAKVNDAGSQITKAREGKKIKIEALARSMSMTTDQLLEIENNKRAPSYHEQIALEKLLDMDIKESVNIEAVQFWIDKWESLYDKFSDVALNVYNRKLIKSVDYTPDRFAFLANSEPKPKDLDDTESSFLANSNYEVLYKTESGSLKEPKPPKGLKGGNMYVNLSFDTNNASAMLEALIDINTAADIRQIQAFKDSDGFKRMFSGNGEDMKLFKERIDLLVKNIRGKRIIVDKAFGNFTKALDKAASYGASMALAGPTQPLKQSLPVMMNTMINTGSIRGFNISMAMNSDVINFINNSGMPIANRGIDAISELESLSKKLETETGTRSGAVLRAIEKQNERYLKWFLANTDIVVARASWISYYEQSLRNQGIKGKVDYSNHEINQKAAEYAQQMVDRQQNISDKDLAGAMYSSGNPAKQLLVKIFLPFATFRLNQTTRMMNDFSIVTSKTASKEDKAVAGKSLSGLLVEMTTFRALSLGLGWTMYLAAQAIRGDEEDDEAQEKKWKNMVKGAFSSAVSDILSPIPPTDDLVKSIFNTLLDQAQSMADMNDEEKYSIFTETQESYSKMYGMLGIVADKAYGLFQDIQLARTGKYKDDFGNEKIISESDREMLSLMLVPYIMTDLAILPGAPEMSSIMRNLIKITKSNSETQTRINKNEAYGGYDTIEKLKEGDPKLYDKLSKKGGALYNLRESQKKGSGESNALFRGMTEEGFRKKFPKEWREQYGPGTEYREYIQSDEGIQEELEKKIQKANDKLEKAIKDREDLLEKAIKDQEDLIEN